MNHIERGITPDDEPQASEVEMAWVNLTPEYAEVMRTRSLEQGADVHPTEGITIWGEPKSK